MFSCHISSILLSLVFIKQLETFYSSKLIALQELVQYPTI